MGHPRVSIVMPCFQQAQFLGFAIQSVIDQTFSDWELIIVDDGSSDNTWEVTRAYREAMPDRIFAIRQKNAGLATARNRGIAAAKGEFILPLDSDDGLHPTYLEKTLAALRDCPEAAIATVAVQTFGVRSEVWPIHRPFELKYLAVSNGLPYASLIRREVWEAVGGYNPNMTLGYEDWDFWIGCAELGYRAAVVHEVLFYYRIKAQSMITQAERSHSELVARIILNHPDVYDRSICARAEETLAIRPLPSPKPNSWRPGPQRVGSYCVSVNSVPDRTTARTALEEESGWSAPGLQLPVSSTPGLDAIQKILSASGIRAIVEARSGALSIVAALRGSVDFAVVIEPKSLYSAEVHAQFSGDPGVVRMVGECRSLLPSILDGMKCPALFLLDNHADIRQTSIELSRVDNRLPPRMGDESELDGSVRHLFLLDGALYFGVFRGSPAALASDAYGLKPDRHILSAGEYMSMSGSCL